MKMYILVRDDIPLGFAMVAVAHASLAGYLKFQNDPQTKEWLEGPFFKVVCKANTKEFANAKLVADHLVLIEAALEQQEVAIVFKPRREWPRMFKYLRLYRDTPNTSMPPTGNHEHVLKGTLPNSTKDTSVPCAAAGSYELLSFEALSQGDVEVDGEFRNREARGEIFSVHSREGQIPRLYPAFQFDVSVDHRLLRDAVVRYRQADLDVSFLWDFLRTVHQSLGGMTGVDFLLGFHAQTLAALPKHELREHFRELIDEEVAHQLW
ncbi:peptidyl-tRNA hydrolase [Acidovorax sp.]|uniref:peptidyl-tRNA hydrolase n=1 Tax=Acidovorax sp. TaxID=1872122 RepID=UPI0025B938DE|nr:peptidyl-tRNA hydrolase [Acidovorax sp.]